VVALGQSPAPAEAEVATQSRLDAPLFYQLLLGELSAFDGQPGQAHSLYLDAARKSDDPRLYERAVGLALGGRDGNAALASARAWQKAHPGSRDANRYVLQILVGLNRIAETVEPLKADLAAAPARERAAWISALPRLYQRASDKKQAAGVVEQGLAEQMAQPGLAAPSWVTVGVMRLEAGDPKGSLDAIARAHEADPSNEAAARVAVALMRPQAPVAEEIVRKHLAAGRPGVDVRMAYARTLMESNRSADAQLQLRAVVAQQSNHPQAWLVLGSLELQDRKAAEAEKSLLRHVELSTQGGRNRTPETNRGLAQAYLQLAQIAEQRKDLAKAEEWLAKVDTSEDLIQAQARRAGLLAKQGKLEEGRKLLRAIPERQPADARLKLMAEIQLLRDHKQLKAAYDLIAERSKSGPPDPELMYDQAMLAEKLGELPEMERLLRAVIAAKPDFQHAYNALGYSLADRNVRLPEARALIKKALEIAPDDPFITDSLGWVEYRAGNLPEAQRVLEKAYKTRPDAEIAAHLGEVLWVSGKREQALAIWREGVALNADNETLLETFKRLRVKP
jgi:tetratricopeptide (TPR) repeat protein